MIFLIPLYCAEKALCETARIGDLDAVKSLIEAKANPNGRFEGNTVLHFAVQSKNLDLVQYLVEEQSVDLNATNGSSESALYKAAEKGSLAIVEYLDQQGAKSDVVLDRTAPLYGAAKGGNLDIVKYFVEVKKIDPRARDHFNRTVLHHGAAESGSLELMVYLVELGVDLNDLGIGDCTVLHSAAKSGSLPLVDYLINKRGFWPHAHDGSDETMLYNAAESGSLELVKSLIEVRFLCPHERNKYGREALRGAVWGKNLAIVKYLIEEKDANPNVTPKPDGDGTELYRVAIMLDEPDMASILFT